MSLEALERRQIWIYAIGLFAGASVGLLLPAVGARVEQLITPVLAVLLYGMFAQIPFLQLREAFANRRFMAALLFSNFVLVPLLVWALAQWLPDESALLLGVYLVLLTPCVDYVVVFTHLGGGNARQVLAATPLLLFVQMAMLPVYLWLFLGPSAVEIMKAGPFLEAFLLLIALPLGLAFGTEYWAKRRRFGETLLRRSAWLPVPFMALTLFFIAASQMPTIEKELSRVALAIPVYIAFMVFAPLLAKFVARQFSLDARAGRALAFSIGTRNSLVVLPLALALPQPWTVVPAIIVTQTLIELIGELLYIRVVPSLFPSHGEAAHDSV
jgi:ACR3 family arsenite transporter